nr:MAG TPA: hypothetical protein [Caudoviricetes sp.]
MATEDIQALLSKVNALRFEDKRIEKETGEIENEIQAQFLRDGKTRSTLTITFMRGFFGLIVFSFIFVIAYNYCAVQWVLQLQSKGLMEASKSIALLELDKVLSIMVSALGTSLGFIIGYYFKDKK